ncbi:unnamed protein product [Mytilus edulis]|uniref:Uncharacterized protein n=1 Tax=Mytilus edulis TaxID=6550 RepID=A0A8S3T398_MYTED|nr:unnamed protein product [Mytilus edulis]
MPVTRNKARKNYKLLSEFGFDQDVLDVSDPTSDIFDHETSPDEVDRLEHRIHNLELSISEKERKLEKSDFEKQGAIPKTRLKNGESSKLIDPVKEKGVVEKSNNPHKPQSSAPKVKSTEIAGKKTKSAKRKDTSDSKSVKRKGEINLDKLRKKKVLTKLVEKQLSDILKKNNLIDLVDSSESPHGSSTSEHDFSSHLRKRKNKSLKKKSSKVPLQYSDSDSDDSIHVPKVKSAKAKKFKKSGSSRVTKHKSRVISESSDSSDYDSFESSTDDDTSSTSGTDSSCKKKSLKKRKVKSGMVAKASDDVQNPQTWPHTTLQYEYINKSVSFQDLDLKLFVAGELEIIGSSKIKAIERNTRLSLLKKIVYYSSIYQWKSLLDFYAAFLRQIETGAKTWKDTPDNLEVPLLSKYVKQEFDKKHSFGAKKETKTHTLWYCSLFQKNKCSKTSPHKILIRGVEREVNHFCATCYRLDKLKSHHPECSSACPHHNE